MGLYGKDIEQMLQQKKNRNIKDRLGRMAAKQNSFNASAEKYHDE